MANNRGILIFLFALLSLFAAGNGQPSPFPDLQGLCGASGSSDSVVFRCSFNNEVVSLRCSFDGGAEEDCSLPLGLSTERFGPGQHTVVLTAIDVFGQSFSTELPFSFSASPPSSVNNLAVNRVTSSGVRITWSPPDSDGGSPVIGYTVELVDFGSPPSAVGLGPDATSYARTGLLPQRTYLLIVRAINSVGEGPSVGILATTTAFA